VKLGVRPANHVRWNVVEYAKHAKYVRQDVRFAKRVNLPVDRQNAVVKVFVKDVKVLVKVVKPNARVVNLENLPHVLVLVKEGVRQVNRSLHLAMFVRYFVRHRVRYFVM